MKYHNEKITNIINGSNSPLPIEIIPNHMGINLCSVDSISWSELDDGQLADLTIHFLPNEKRNNGQ